MNNYEETSQNNCFLLFVQIFFTLEATRYEEELESGKPHDYILWHSPWYLEVTLKRFFKCSETLHWGPHIDDIQMKKCTHLV